ncbi:hypothetical protein HPB52_024755 [Rhipicephalus sanguineus]|uniref:Helicase ATP-binding domain-containing protein n=1 Tax=Rhipicephalus sanguineus TaxID=34632 RepID=A0A9D4PDY2_RHISA|nr:hypothetical protein HPB52_020586 [Rhipicephalus sanguineus]KAH7986738.1 hypothetical protein HPB52_024755 [Rhipicephalus sanguineus]
MVSSQAQLEEHPTAAVRELLRGTPGHGEPVDGRCGSLQKSERGSGERARRAETYTRLGRVQLCGFIVKGIEAGRGYALPTPIEANCWPTPLSCRNVVGIAETGSHKMLAYVLPAVIHDSRHPPRQRHEGPIAVLLAPTREVAKQIHSMAYELGKHAAERIVCAANGERKKSKYAELQGGCHIFVATPRCLIEFLEEGQVNLHRCTYLVFDEVDRMLSMGYQRHVLKIVELCRPDRQTLMWATS